MSNRESARRQAARRGPTPPELLATAFFLGGVIAIGRMLINNGDHIAWMVLPTTEMAIVACAGAQLSGAAAHRLEADVATSDRRARRFSYTTLVLAGPVVVLMTVARLGDGIRYEYIASVLVPVQALLIAAASGVRFRAGHQFRRPWRRWPPLSVVCLYAIACMLLVVGVWLEGELLRQHVPVELGRASGTVN